MKLLILLLLTMSLSGSVAFLLYLLISVLADRQINAAFRYVTLKLCLAFFLIPFPLLKYALVRTFTPIDLAVPFPEFLDLSDAFIQTKNGFSLRDFPDFHKVLLGIWVSAMVLLIIKQLYVYLKFNYRVTRYLEKDESKEKMLLSFQKQLKVHSHVGLYRCEAAVSPFTYGAIHPKILLTGVISNDSSDLILQHELQHIRSHDFLYRVLAMLAVLLHCFNPLIFLFFRKLTEAQELNCDEKMVKNLSPEDRKRYGHLLINMTACDNDFPVPAVFFSKNTVSFLKKRILQIKDFPPKKTWVMRLLFFLLCVVSSIPVCAYSPKTLDLRNNMAFTPDDFPAECTWISFSPSENPVPEDEFLFQYTDEYFITDNGTVIDMTRNLLPRAGCSHTYISGHIKRHIVSGKGCIVETYSATYCTKCGLIKTKKLISSNNYVECLHK